MVIESGKIYFIKDEFIERYGEKYNLMRDHEDEKNRPCYFCFRDDKCNDMLWFVPMSTQYNKYFNIYCNIKEKIKKEPNNFIFFDNIAGKKTVFLLQNMFPTLERYVKEKYIKKEKDVKVPIHIQQSIMKKAKSIIRLSRTGITVTFTNLPKFILDIENELKNLQEK